MSAAAKLPPHRLTIDEFVEWADSLPGKQRWQLRDGEPELIAPPSVPHGSLLSELAILLGPHLRATGDRCGVYTGVGVVPRARADHNMLVPDLAVACDPIEDLRALRKPLVLIEILSPSNEAQTRANVWAYTTIPTVAEIILISSIAVAAEVLRRDPDGDWPERPLLLGADDALSVGAIDFACPLRALYHRTPLGADTPAMP